MADSVDFTLVGMDKLLDKFEALENEVKYKGGRFALRKAANLIASKAKQGAARIDDPQTSQDIEKNIAVRWSGRTFKATGNPAFRVGVMGGAGGSKPTEYYKDNPGGDTRHWRYVEFGTHNHRAEPFMRPALENNINQAVTVFGDELEKKIARLLKAKS